MLVIGCVVGGLLPMLTVQAGAKKVVCIGPSSVNKTLLYASRAAVLTNLMSASIQFVEGDIQLLDKEQLGVGREGVDIIVSEVRVYHNI